MQVDIWDHERSEPISELSWGSDTVTAVRFNPAEADLLASAGSDRSVALYDLRSSSAIRKIVMQVSRTFYASNGSYPRECCMQECCRWHWASSLLDAALLDWMEGTHKQLWLGS